MSRIRYKFIKIIIFLFICSSIGGGWQYYQNTQQFTLNIIHTNDLHAHLIPFNLDNRTCDYQSKECRGGYARIKTLIDSYRAKYPHTVLLDAGDRFSGTVFYTLRKSQDIIRLMNDWQYDALTLGNHDFDDGIGEIEKMMKQFQAPVICSNAVFPKTTPLAQLIKPAVILEKGNRKIGVIGALTPDVKTETVHAKEIQLLPLAQTIQAEVDKLQKQQVDIIILLSHIGFDKDQSIAKQVTGIDVIVGGHTHTLLSNNSTEAEGVYPTVIKNPEQKPVLIVSAGIGGQHIGNLAVTFDNRGDIQSYSGNTVVVDNTIPPNTTILNDIITIEQKLENILQEPIVSTATPVSLTPQTLFCSQSCYVGEILTNSLKQIIPNVDVVILNAGSIRAGLPQGTITFQHLAQSFPFDSYGAIVSLSGEQILTYLTHGLKKYNPKGRTNAFLQTAGLSYSFNPQTKQLVSVTINNQPVEPDKIYRVAMPSFIAGGGDGYPEHSEFEVIPESIRLLMKKAMQSPDYKVPPFENRIQTIQPDIQSLNHGRKK